MRPRSPTPEPKFLKQPVNKDEAQMGNDRSQAAEGKSKVIVPEVAELEAPGMPAAQVELDQDKPFMSATSYPGQEWNPYSMGVVEDWE